MGGERRFGDRVPVGASGLRVSPVCLGVTKSWRVVPEAFDAGINFFFVRTDLHWPVYQPLRKGLQELLSRGGGVRDEIVVAAASYVATPEFAALPFLELIASVRGLGRV